MKAYGIPGGQGPKCPDVADIHAHGSKSCVGSVKGKGGDYRGLHKNKEKKKQTRRIWKRKERAKAKKVCYNYRWKFDNA